MSEVIRQLTDDFGLRTDLVAKVFSSSDTMGFVLGEWTPCVSSNVAEAMYDEGEQTLYIGFDGGDPGGGVDYHAYFGVNFDMAMSFANAPSKGIWVWENLRRTGWPATAIERNRVPKGKRKRA